MRAEEVMAHLQPAAVLNRIESIMAGGFGIDRIVLRSGVQEIRIRELIQRSDRSSLPHRDPLGHLDNQQVDSLQALQKWLEEYERAQEEGGRAIFADTPMSRNLIGVCRKASAEKLLILVVGSWGIGKSYTFRKFATDYPMTLDRPGAAFISLVEADKGPAIYQKVDRALSMEETHVTRANSLYRNVPNRLRAGDVLIFDEGNYLFEKGAWKTVRDIYDNSEASIIINCNEVAVSDISAEGARIGAFMSRCRRFFFMEGNNEADVEKFMGARGYAGEDLIRAAVTIATKNDATGGLRGLSNALDEAEAIARAKGERVSAESLGKAHRAVSYWIQPKTVKRGRA